MTNMTVNGVTTTKALGQEKYELFTRRVGRQTKRFVQYDYRNMSGELFSCVKPTLEDCRLARDKWVKGETT